MRVHYLLRLAVTTVVLGGCASAPAEFQAPDGTKLKMVKCSSDKQECFVAASQSCAAGGTYRVISSESHAGGLLADVMPGPVTWYGMTYACGPSDGKMPDFKFQGQQYVAPQPSAQQAPTTTTCNSFGSTVTCKTR